ncbi:MAG: tRNA glutamyl-Q(34) synthetase GluQRS [Wenzhouxiangella sp.]|nr:tRNA glutamyl-Q(34) synthetase GluQRS [Wenzhouxiangella sp.]
MNTRASAYRGRFAPSPTGELHFGSLVAALGSFLQARSRGGRWLVRIEDIDPPREVPGAAASQLKTLAEFGLTSDEPVLYQSQLGKGHLQALTALLQSGQAYHCACSRRELPDSGIYPGTCRNGLPTGRRARSVRARAKHQDISFIDGIQGPQSQNPGLQSGDFVIRRADGLIAYQLAVVVDDANAGITEVVRGADLIESTARQIQLYRYLGWPVPAYAHLPLIVDDNGEKLSKSSGSDPIRRYRHIIALRLALRALGHEPPAGHKSLDSILTWAQRRWQLERVPVGPSAIGVQPG